MPLTAIGRPSGFAAVLALWLASGAHGNEGQLPICADGWKIEVVAEAPQIKHPSVVCCAPDGRVFVAEDPMDISTPTADVAHGRILCLSPDGTIKVFAENLFAVFGMQYIDGYLYVLHNPKFTRFRDQDGRGTDRIDLIEQTHPRPWDLNWNDHVPANFRLAMDGYLYVAVGDKGLFGAVGRDNKRVDLRGGGILRLRPDGTELEIYCSGVRNILDVAMDAEGELFTYDNTDEHGWMGRLTHMVDGGFYGYPYDFQPQRPYTLWMMDDFGGGAATGALCYVEDALPAEYHGNLFLADFGKRQILRVQIARSGATFRVVSRTDMFLDPPGDFRPVGIALSPDGASIYICDWNHTDTKDMVTCGRLLRLTYLGEDLSQKKPNWYVSAALGEKSRGQLDDFVAGLRHPAMSVRLVAQRRLAERSDSYEPLLKVLRDSSESLTTRSHALWVLDALDGAEAGREPIFGLLDNSDVGLRRQLIRQLGTRRVVDACPLLIDALEDEDASIRFQAATALGRISDEQAVPSLIEALDESDLFARFAVFTALNRMGRNRPAVWPDIVSGLAHDKQIVRDGIAFATRDVWQMDLVDALARWSADTTHDSMSRAISIQLLTDKLYKPPAWNGEWWAYHPALKAPADNTEPWQGTNRIVDELRNRIVDDRDPVRLAAIVGLRQAAGVQALTADETKRSLRDALASENHAEIRTQIIYALGELQDADAAPSIIAAIQHPNTSRNERVAAVTAAGQIGGMNLSETLVDFIRTAPADEPLAVEAAARAIGHIKIADAVDPLIQLVQLDDESIRLAVFDALARIGNDAAIAALSKLTESDSLQVREGATGALGEIRSAKATEALLQTYALAESRQSALLALTRQPAVTALDAYLEGLASANADLRYKCRQAIHAVRSSVRAEVEQRLPQLSDEVIARLQDIYRDDAEAQEGPVFERQVVVFDPAEYLKFVREHDGDPRRGRQVFEDAAGMGCAKCHAVNGIGGRVGPDLSHIGEQFDRLQLADHVLYPNRSIREGYRQSHVVLEDGRQFVGIVASETTDELLLRDTDGKEHLLAKSEIEARSTVDQSLMPDRIVESVSPETFADLISYLQELRRRSAATP